jgi:hypothetical protein
MTMKLVLVFLLSLVTTVLPNTGITDDFETGYKYVIDHQSAFEGMTADEFAVAINRQFGAPEAFRVRTLTNALNDNNTWSEDLDRIMGEFNTGIGEAKDYKEFLLALTIFENGASRLGSEERQGVLLYIRNIRDLMHLLFDSLQYYNLCCDMDASGAPWWDKWGRCAASIIGGTGTGALAGAAIGSVPVPAIGTILGGVIGGISGGLMAAAENC